MLVVVRSPHCTDTGSFPPVKSGEAFQFQFQFQFQKRVQT
jgi:hypothetical protein